jgi:dTDP-4-amino-4,6-dideoxy-D-galactose acyltransferase
MAIEELKWDSSFFKLKIGILKTENHLVDFLEADINSFDLIYIEEKKNNKLPKQFLSKFNITYTDEKITYVKKVKKNTALDQKINQYLLPVANKKLIELSIQSGAFSRFKLDNHFKLTQYKKFYTTWIKNSVQHKIADKLLVYGDIHSPSGFITIIYKNNFAQIGLIAVDTNCQNSGIGTTLISAAEYFAFKHNFTTLQVVTQAANKNACSFYEKYGFKKREIIYTHHHWK